MEPLVEAVQAADSVWAVLAIAIIGLYVLVWKFGGQLLSVARENNVVAKEAHAEVKSVSESIVTNHGSKNMGDAIDRITEVLQVLSAESQSQLAAVQQVSTDLAEHISQQALKDARVEGRIQAIENLTRRS
jgi:hypothetical protein